jgi:hypothetical protein
VFDRPADPRFAYEGVLVFPHDLKLPDAAAAAALTMTYSYVYNALAPPRRAEFTAACHALAARAAGGAARPLRLPLLTRAFVLRRS